MKITKRQLQKMIKEARIETLTMDQTREPARMITGKMLVPLGEVVSIAAGAGIPLEQVGDIKDVVWDYVLNEVAPQIIEIVQGELVK